MIKVLVEPYEIPVLVFSSSRGFLQYIKRSCTRDTYRIIAKDLKEASAFTVKTSSHGDSEIVIYTSDRDLLLDHELIHATWFILDDKGVILTVSNHEAQTYLFTSLKKQILNKWKKD